MGYDWGHPMLWGGWLFMVTFWVLLVIGIVWLVRALVQGRGPAPPEASRAETILEERFARGEITAEEFRHMREELRSARDRS